MVAIWKSVLFLQLFFFILAAFLEVSLEISLGLVSLFFKGDDDEIPQELLLGKHQLSELGSESAKIKAMGIMDKVNLHSL